MVVRENVLAGWQLAHPPTADDMRLIHPAHLICWFIAAPLTQRATGVLLVFASFGSQARLPYRRDPGQSAGTIDVAEQLPVVFFGPSEIIGSIRDYCG